MSRSFSSLSKNYFCSRLSVCLILAQFWARLSLNSRELPEAISCEMRVEDFRVSFLVSHRSSKPPQHRAQTKNLPESSKLYMHQKAQWNVSQGFVSLSKTSADNVILQNFHIFSHDFSLFSTQLTLFRPKNSIGLKKDWIHVRKCQKFAKSSCRPMFSQQNKTLENIPLRKERGKSENFL